MKKNITCILLLVFTMSMLVACGGKNSHDETGVMVRDTKAGISTEAQPEYSMFEELSGKTVSMLRIFAVLRSSEYLPISHPGGTAVT